MLIKVLRSRKVGALALISSFLFAVFSLFRPFLT
jgi:hypothetical protein